MMTDGGEDSMEGSPAIMLVGSEGEVGVTVDSSEKDTGQDFVRMSKKLPLLLDLLNLQRDLSCFCSHGWSTFYFKPRRISHWLTDCGSRTTASSLGSIFGLVLEDTNNDDAG